jgi:hypothetical protein
MKLSLRFLFAVIVAGFPAPLDLLGLRLTDAQFRIGFRVPLESVLSGRGRLTPT